MVDEDDSNIENMMVHTPVNISLYDIKEPVGILGPIANVDTVVIPDHEFAIYFDYPLTYPIHIHVKTDGPTRTRELLQLVQYYYEYIYRVEEETAPATTFYVERICEACINSKQTHTLRRVSSPQEPMCSICYEAYTDESDVSACRCNHEFHTACITRWINQGPHQSCPMCRTSVYNCSVCSNTNVVMVEHTSVILPWDMRPDSRRNRTYGLYGIYDTDYESLVVDAFVYDNVSKTVYISMSRH